MNSIRKSYEVYNEEHIERYCDDSFYAFTRGDVFIALTNDDSNGQLTRTISYHPYSAGDQLCNLLYEGDCITVAEDNTFNVYLLNGEAKIFVPQTS